MSTMKARKRKRQLRSSKQEPKKECVALDYHTASLTEASIQILDTLGHEEMRDSLTGIGPIDVLVEEIEFIGSCEAARNHLKRTALQTAVELRLRINAIPVDLNAAPVLYAQVGVVELAAGYAFSAGIQLHQTAELQANNRVTSVRTWQMTIFGRVADVNRICGVIESLQELTDTFSNHYLTANPRVS